MLCQWSEPEGCTTARGWFRVAWEDHPQWASADDRERSYWRYAMQDDFGPCFGNYLDYERPQDNDRPLERVHASCYRFRFCPVGYVSCGIGSKWFATVAEAKAWIEETIGEYLASQLECVA